jgi:beta-xylosidase
MKSLSFTIFAILCVIVFSQKNFTNPVIPGKDLPDPGVLYYNGAYYVANTGGGSARNSYFPIHKSTDLQTWVEVGAIFTEAYIPKWSGVGEDFWAPELHIINGKLRAVFTAREKSSKLLCIGVATANDILGPYTDRGAPLIRNTTVGSIDATVMTVSDSTYYVVWKDDGNGNKPEIPTWIKAQQLTNDGVDVTGDVHYLIRNTLPWEADLVEGPWVIQKGGYYYLFYSGNGYCGTNYAVGVARSQSPLGPYTKKGDPILHSNTKFVGPGHCSVVQDVANPGSWVMVYHSWIQGHVCNGNPRVLMADYVYFSADNWPYLANNSPTEVIV